VGIEKGENVKRSRDCLPVHRPLRIDALAWFSNFDNNRLPNATSDSRIIRCLCCISAIGLGILGTRAVFAHRMNPYEPIEWCMHLYEEYRDARCLITIVTVYITYWINFDDVRNQKVIDPLSAAILLGDPRAQGFTS